jgi:hypothetical protein
VQAERDAQTAAATAKELVVHLKEALAAAHSAARRDASRATTATTDPSGRQMNGAGRTDGNSPEMCKEAGCNMNERSPGAHSENFKRTNVAAERPSHIYSQHPSENAPNAEVLLLRQRLHAAAARVEDAVAVANAAAAVSATPTDQVAAMSAALERTCCLLRECAFGSHMLFLVWQGTNAFERTAS